MAACHIQPIFAISEFACGRCWLWVHDIVEKA